MPVIDRAVLAVDRQHAGRALGGGHRRVRRGQRAEIAGEPLLARIVQANTAENERLVLVQRRPDRGHSVRVQPELGAQAGDLGADAGGELADAEARAGRCRGHGASFLMRHSPWRWMTRRRTG